MLVGSELQNDLEKGEQRGCDAAGEAPSDTGHQQTSILNASNIYVVFMRARLPLLYAFRAIMRVRRGK